MGKSLAEYAQEHPQAAQQAWEHEEMQQQARTIKDRQQTIQEAQELKESITKQLTEGNAPQYILYTAIKAIGLLSNDPLWTEAARAILDGVYSDLAQQSFLTDNEAIAAARLDKMQQDYNSKLRRQLERSLDGYKRIAKGIDDALTALNELDTQEPLPGNLKNSGKWACLI